MTMLGKKSRFTDRKINKVPQGATDGVNLEYTIPDDEEFWPETLEVMIDGIPKESGFDFEELGTTGFRFLIDPDDDFNNMMKHPVLDTERITISYWKKPKCK